MIAPVSESDTLALSVSSATSQPSFWVVISEDTLQYLKYINPHTLLILSNNIFFNIHVKRDTVWTEDETMGTAMQKAPRWKRRKTAYTTYNASLINPVRKYLMFYSFLVAQSWLENN